MVGHMEIILNVIPVNVSSILLPITKNLKGLLEKIRTKLIPVLLKFFSSVHLHRHVFYCKSVTLMNYEEVCNLF